MADTVPICDVLSEAMEYLTKLGTNIRIRSENLKEKRIRKDKLNNTHAIHKAVDKVLLICELSKKSIENVETGVKNLLLQMEKSGSTFGPSRETPRSSKSDDIFEYFMYESQKLKLPDKISVVHYTSVKVLSTCLTLSLLNKYPVYYDCKLYRMRNNKKRTLSDNVSECTAIQDLDEMGKSREESCTNTKDEAISKSQHDKSESLQILQLTHNEEVASITENENKDNNTVNKLGTLKTDGTVEKVIVCSDENKDNSDCENRSKKKKYKDKLKRFKHIKVIDASSSSENENSNAVEKTIKGKQDEEECLINIHSKVDVSDEETCVQSLENQGDIKASQTSETIKPMIKCVSLSKLLKPDRVKDFDVKNTKESKKNCKKNISVKRKYRSSKSNTKKEYEVNNKNQMLETFDVEDNECAYLTAKRKAVEHFKPKEFNINLTRLPEFTQIVLEKYNLKRVTQNGSVLCEIFNNMDEGKSDSEPKSKRKKIINNSLDKNMDINKVKSVLLNDSDSDNIESCQNNKSTIFNSALKNSSDRQKYHAVDNDKQKTTLLPIEPDIENVNIKQNERSSQCLVEVNEKIQEKKTSDTELEKSYTPVKQSSSKQGSHNNEPELNYVGTGFLHISSDELQTGSDKDEIDLSKIEETCKGSKQKDKFKHALLEGSDCESQKDKQAESTDLDKVKKSLLNESDSDICNEALQVSSAVKNALLADSDCDIQNESEGQFNVNNLNDSNDEQENSKTIGDQTEKCNTPITGDSINTNKVKETLVHQSDHHINVQEETTATVNREKDCQEEFQGRQDNVSTQNQNINKFESSKDTEELKSSLLQDSSDGISKTPPKRKISSGNSPPQSKRKHIMESMYAKKMLLTSSSSSDTEDEQLRSTLKEIKDYLFDDIDSSQDCKLPKMEEKADGIVEGSVSKSDLLESEELQSEKESKKSKTIEGDKSASSTSGSVTDKSDESKMGRSSATPDGRCSPNTDIKDAHDKEIDGLINLKSLKKTYRRRRSTSSEHTQSTRSDRSGRRLRMASGLISKEGFLEAESSSDAASLSGSDHADNVDPEEEPRLKLTDINGDSIGHLAKDDLLGESDSSMSHDEKKSLKKQGDTDDDNVKSKRRKAIAISSDSEAGSSRRKHNNEFRMSDTDDSEDENSEPAKNKRKKKVIESDESGGSSDDGKKKRRRIKSLDDSEGSGSDTGNEGRNKHGRKNIRKVMSKNQLEEATKKAARQEKERIARITERQKLYNNLEFDESGKPDEVVLEKVVLDFDPETKEPLIQVDRGLVKKLKPHQANGIKFMWDACFESVKRIKKDKGSGCILAHCMGLGKTLQVVSLTHTLLTHGSLTGVNRVLVVCPLSTVLNWVNEFGMWLKHAEADYEVDVYELSKFKQNSERAFQLSQWFEHGGVCVLGYEMFRNLSADKGKKFKKKILKNFQESLVDPGPDLVVCDEGHLLKNEKTSLSQSMNRVKTLRRIVLTGTPLQNNLKEYYCMVQFVKPNLLGKYNEYLNRFVNPITNGQYTDSTEQDIRVMKRRSHVLHKMLDGAVQRRDYGVLAPFLPPKHEYVLFITLTDVQIKLYHHYLDNYSRRPQPGKSSGFLFPDFQSLQRIWTHPMVLKYNSERYEIMQQKKREREEEDSEGSLIDFIDDDSTPDESSTEESSDDLSDLSDDSRKKSKKKKSGKKGKGKDNKATTRRGTRANPIEIDDDEPIETIEVKNENPTEWWMKLVNEEELEDMRNSHKLILLFDILRQCEAIGDKLLVFSQSLYSLDLIEYFLGKVDEATQAGRIDEKLGGHVGSWSTGVDYFRLDGSTSCENRSIWCKNFNRTDNQRARLFLISTRAGGLGINLVAANRVVIFDVSWNPSHDVQSIFRVYRFGQKKPCYVYRFLAMGTMEEKIYERQVTKQAISKRVIDEQQIDRHYAENDLAELYKFEPQPPVPRPLPPLPKDRLFAEMLKEHETQIYKYHEHDSLLENKEEETLSEEERRAAWEDFENEKTRPPPQPFLSPYAMHNGMVQGLLAQQQQMAMAAISAMLRKSAPNMSDKQIRETVPLLLASNPGMFGGYDYGLIPNMSEMYKYPQPGMMNHPMMNPMNAGGDMSGGSGMGASALHYEPPWQRQQQQQQQLRLQQLMQHQNSMGAKYYAGGLGSRDPMAMALQQQRARELMHRPRARGRPPLASTAPRPLPAHGASDSAGDVVNLDSD